MNLVVQQHRSMRAVVIRLRTNFNRTFSNFQGKDLKDSKFAFFSRPSPPPLPAKDQEEFQRLLKQQQTPFFMTTTTTSSSSTNFSEELHPDLRVKPPVEFEGDVNPKTGEVGGPKRDPLKWEREWAYGGRSQTMPATRHSSANAVPVSRRTHVVAFGHPYLCTPTLLEIFEREPCPSYDQISEIMTRTSLTRKQITSWFWRKRKERAKASHPPTSITKPERKPGKYFSSFNINATSTLSWSTSEPQSPFQESFEEEDCKPLNAKISGQASSNPYLTSPTSPISNSKQIDHHPKPRVIRCSLKSQPRSLSQTSDRPETFLDSSPQHGPVPGRVPSTKVMWSDGPESDERTKAQRAAAFESLYYRSSDNFQPAPKSQLPGISAAGSASGLKRVSSGQKSALSTRTLSSALSWTSSRFSDDSGLGPAGEPLDGQMAVIENDGASWFSSVNSDSASVSLKSQDSIEDFSAFMESPSIDCPPCTSSNTQSHRSNSSSSGTKTSKMPMLVWDGEVEADPVLFSTPYQPFWKRWEDMFKT